MARHFKLTNETKVNIFGVKLFRIECTVDCKWAKVGDKGGWVEKEDNIQGDSAWVGGEAEVSGEARVGGSAWVGGSARVGGEARVGDSADYCCFQSFGRGGRTTTVFREKSGELRVQCGCFNGTLAEFEAQVEQTHGDTQHGKVYKAIIEVIKLKFAKE